MKRKLILNTTMSLLLQITTVICGFILPRLILEYYGSEVNGLIQSIAQFLYIVTFLEMGVGQVIQSSLYKPLSTGDLSIISKILKSGSKYFRTIASILVVYIFALAAGSSYVFGGTNNWTYTATLTLVIGLNSFAQYYFGLGDKILLNADQRGYIQYTIQIISNVLNIFLVSFLIRSGFSIQIVKLVTAVIFLMSPIAIRLYVNKHYKIDRRISYAEEPIKQKWNGVAQHVATVALEGTDIIVLTLFSTLSNVSIYSVYYMIVSGIKQLYTAATNGIQSMVGTLWAQNDKRSFESVFQCIETVLHFVVVYLFTCVVILIVPFIKVYTFGIEDCDYIYPAFALILTIAYAIRCLRTPYNIVILAGGHYKQTQTCHIVSALLNIVISVIAVSFFGLIGIAIGTLIAYVYQTIWMMHYISKNLLCWPIRKVLKQLIVDLALALSIYFSSTWIELGAISYLSWISMAIFVAVIGLVITVVLSLMFYFPVCRNLLRMIKKR